MHLESDKLQQIKSKFLLLDPFAHPLNISLDVKQSATFDAL